MSLRIFCWIALLWSHSLVAQDSSALKFPSENGLELISNGFYHPSQIQIIYADDILASGYMRLSEVFQLIHGFTFHTINGDRWQLEMTGNTQNQHWVFMLNGVEIDFSSSEAYHVNLLGISIADILRIEVISAAGIFNGRWTDQGLIHIITKAQKKPLSASIFYGTGNEVGDPGPRRFLPGSAKNVDKIGYNHGLKIGGAFKNWSVELTHVDQQYFMREGVILNRVNSLSERYLAKHDFESFTGNVGFKGKKGVHRLDALYGKGSDIINPNGLFTEELGQHKNFFLGYQGLIQASRSRIRLRLQWQEQNLAMVSNSWFSSISTNQHGWLAFEPNARSAKGLIESSQFGIEANWRSAETVRLASATLPDYAIFGKAVFRLGSYWRLVNASALSYFENKLYPKFSLALSAGELSIHHFRFQISYTEKSKAESIRSFADLHSDSSQIIKVGWTPDWLTSQQTSAGFYYSGFNDSDWKLNVHLAIHQTQNSPLIYDVQTPAFLLNDTLNISWNASIWRSSAGLRLDHVGKGGLKFHLSYLWSEVSSESQLRLNHIPAHKVIAWLSYPLPERFLLHLKGYYQSPTDWSTFYDPALNLETLAVSQSLIVPGFFNADLGLSKKAFGERFDVNFSLRNIFNGRSRYHPLGAQFDLMLAVSLRIRL